MALKILPRKSKSNRNDSLDLFYLSYAIDFAFITNHYGNLLYLNAFYNNLRVY